MGRSLVVAAVLAAVMTSGAQAEGKVAARGSAEQVQVTGARPHAKVVLKSQRGRTVQTQRAGKLGGVVFRDVRPGAYRVGASKVKVFSTRGTPPSTKTYRQDIPSSGYGYLTTRDGTKLAIAVRLPSGAKPPYPTLVEYSGYGYADPAGGESSIAQIAQLLGYAVVDVNMRGTGCSGGAFDYFEPLQGLDGYDVIETVARQPWALHHKVGMMGISYGGISQLFVAATRPPSLAAITPLSVIDNTQTTLYPGGILNTGFALSWAKDRVADARAATATAGGQEWARKRIAGGDATCKANQALHPEAVDLLKKQETNDVYVPKVADPLSPITFVNKITAPTFLACQFTDEQTGGHCPALTDHFTGTKDKWFTFTNGTHIDSLDPATFTRWYDFLELYVAKRAPHLSDALKGLAPTVFSTAMGVSGLTLPADPIQQAPDYAGALTAWRAQPPVRVAFDNGAGGPAPFAPGPGYVKDFASWPIPGTTGQTFGPGADGSFTWSMASRPATSFSGNTAGGANGLWTATPSYRWSEPAPGSVYSWTSDPLKGSATVVGAGRVQASITTDVPDVDLQATVSEIRPDGGEVFVQSGWLRASMRKLDAAKSTELAPVLSLRAKDRQPLIKGKATNITIPLYYQGHAYRAGSRIRVTLGPPRGDQPIWAFAKTVPRTGTPAVSVSGLLLTLPVVPTDVPTPLPAACASLRGEPCR
jgi:uncharacterized protein